MLPTTRNAPTQVVRMTTRTRVSPSGQRVVTIEETARAMDELATGTDPSLLHALRGAALSVRMNLRCNTAYTAELYPWRNDPLPQRYILTSILEKAVRRDGTGRPAWGLMKSHVETLVAIDAFWFGKGNQDVAYAIGTTLDEQRAWRCRMNSLVYGLGFKCLSWALFIYQPEHCQLLTLDSWHSRRLQVEQSTLMRDSETSHALYERKETQLIDEVTALYPGYLPTIGAACLWYNMRGQGPESHAGLNCRV